MIGTIKVTNKCSGSKNCASRETATAINYKENHKDSPYTKTKHIKNRQLVSINFLENSHKSICHSFQLNSDFYLRSTSATIISQYSTQICQIFKQSNVSYDNPNYQLISIIIIFLKTNTNSYFTKLLPKFRVQPPTPTSATFMNQHTTQMKKKVQKTNCVIQ